MKANDTTVFYFYMEDEIEDALRRHYWRSVYTKRPKENIYSKVADRETLISVHLAFSASNRSAGPRPSPLNICACMIQAEYILAGWCEGCVADR